MEKEKSNVPKLRFSGFTDDWEQRKFSELVIIERGGSPRPIESYITEEENGLNWVKIGDAPEMGNYITKTAQKIKPEGLKKTREVHPGDLILSNSMSFGRPYIMAIDGCIHDGWLLIRDEQKLFDLKFLCALLGTDSMLNQYTAMAAGSTVNNLNKELVGNTTVFYPSLAEQRVIGNFLTKLDEAITLHQRKLDQIKEYKNGMLQKMFPKEGETVPEVRFPGFEGEWEQRKLHTLMDFSNGFNGNAELYGKGIPFISVMDILNNAYITFESIRGKVDIDDNTLMRFAVNYGDVLFQRSSENFEDAGSSNVYIGDKTAAFGGFVIRGRRKAEYDAYFMKSLLDSDAVRKQITSKAQGAQHINVSQETLSDIILRIPSIEEQVFVGRLFATMNEAVILHQRKLEAMKEYKKGLLQQMFV